jgi:Sulfotransferase family
VTLPNFIVIGAAKAGTTALYWYLAEHPAVFMSPIKETNYFAYGVDAGGRLLYGDPEHHTFPVRTLAEYQQLFAEAGRARAIGEASPIYLECPQAAERIRELLPSVRLVCTLRHPVERAYSDYLMFLRSHGRSFDPAVELSAGAGWARPDSHWMRISRYAESLRTYLDRFPRAQLHVLMFDDLKRAPVAEVQSVYRFLDVDPGFVPDLETPHNIGGIPASRAVERFLTSKRLRAAVQPWMPTRAVNWVRRVRTRNLRSAPPLPAELKRELTLHFRDDITRTSQLIGRSLDHWL